MIAPLKGSPGYSREAGFNRFTEASPVSTVSLFTSVQSTLWKCLAQAQCFADPKGQRNWTLLSLKPITFSPCSCGNAQLGEKDKKGGERGRREKWKGREGGREGSRDPSSLSHGPSVCPVCRVLEFLSKPSAAPARIPNENTHRNPRKGIIKSPWPGTGEMTKLLA